MAEYEEKKCSPCSGSGWVYEQGSQWPSGTGLVPCSACDGSGVVTERVKEDY